jgi:cysteine-rich repeat protein
MGGAGDSGGEGGGGEPSVDPFPYEGCVLSGKDPSNLAGAGGAGGSDAGGAPNEPGPAPELNGDCGEAWGELSCSGTDVTTSLVCNMGKWERFGTCEQGQTCDPNGGICADAVDVCSAQGAGHTFCEADELVRCTTDLRLERAECCGVCIGGSCEAPRCGDRRVTGHEACDDGNTVAGDGCERDCKPSAVVALSGGGGHTCALLRGGAVRCWGDNRYGQLGLASKSTVSNKHPYELETVDLGSPAKALALGSDHTCALLESGDVRCWGKNDRGQLGLAHTQNVGDDEGPSTKFAQVQLGAKAESIAAGGDATCVVMKNGSVRCWGANTHGQLGLGHTQDIGNDESPVAAEAEVSLGAKTVSVAVASEHACALLEGLLIRCWGHNDVGQLGLGHVKNIGDDELPTDAQPINFVKGASPAIYSLSAGGKRACIGIDQGLDRGMNWCWGYNGDGGLGVGTVENRPNDKADYWGLFWWGQPTEQVVVGSTHQCVRLYNHAVYCWGLNAKGQLGQPFLEASGDDENPGIHPPLKFPRGDGDTATYPKQITAGESHTCALLNTGAVTCWGHNDRGQLGLGFASSAPTDYVGGDAAHTPDKLAATRVLPAAL